MSGGPTYTIDQILNPTEHKATHDGLSDGSEDVDANKLELYRSEALNDFIASGGLWSADSFGGNLIASMTSVVAYIGGKRIVSSSVSAHDFTASKYTIIDLGDDGVIDYAEATSIPTVPTLATNHIRLAIIITSATVTTHVIDRRNLSPLSIARVKLLEGTLDDIWIDNIPNLDQFKVKVTLVDTGGTIAGGLTFNSDTGSNYSRRLQNPGSGDTNTVNQSVINLINTGTDIKHITFTMTNLATKAKLGNWESTEEAANGAGTAPIRNAGAFKWHNTSDQINLVQLNNIGSCSYASGSKIIIEGNN